MTFGGYQSESILCIKSHLHSTASSNMATSVHTTAKTGFGTGTNELYDRARPSYQSNAISHIRQAVNSTSPLNIVEIGSGTGIFTRALLAHPEWASSVGQLKAIEPSEGMRDTFLKTVKDDRVTVAEGSFDKTSINDGWADIVVIAQAFHWCPNYDSASTEFARILKPNGIVAFIWNLEDRDAARWVAQIRNRIESHEQGTPQFRLGLWRQTWDTPSYKANFDPPKENEWAYNLSSTLDVVTNRAHSKSYIAVLSENEKASVAADIEDIVQRGDDKVWIDESKGVFEYPYKTYVVISHKKL